MIVVNPAEAGHAEALARLNHRVQALHAVQAGRFFKPPKLESATSWFQDILTRPHTRCWIACDGDDPVGYVLAFVYEKPADCFTHERRWLYLDQISVDEQWGKRGIGTKLVQTLFNQARDEGVTEVETDTWAFNTSAQGFFERLGFKPKSLKHLLTLGAEPPERDGERA